MAWGRYSNIKLLTNLLKISELLGGINSYKIRSTIEMLGAYSLYFQLSGFLFWNLAYKLDCR